MYIVVHFLYKYFFLQVLSTYYHRDWNFILVIRCIYRNEAQFLRKFYSHLDPSGSGAVFCSEWIIQSLKPFSCTWGLIHLCQTYYVNEKSQLILRSACVTFAKLSIYFCRTFKKVFALAGNVSISFFRK